MSNPAVSDPIRAPSSGHTVSSFDSSNVERRFMSRHVARAALIIVAMPVALRWLAPWKLFIRTTIGETLPPGAQTTCLGEFTSHIHRAGVLTDTELMSGYRRFGSRLQGHPTPVLPWSSPRTTT